MDFSQYKRSLAMGGSLQSLYAVPVAGRPIPIGETGRPCSGHWQPMESLPDQYYEYRERYKYTTRAGKQRECREAIGSLFSPLWRLAARAIASRWEGGWLRL